MAKLPPRENPTAEAIFNRYAENAEDWRRSHLGASLIGHSCHRFLWNSFRWVSQPNFSGRMLRLFERGNREESWVVEDLRAIGMQVVDRDESQVDENGEHPQFRQSWHGGHFGGGCDGKVLGVFEAPKTAHVLEVKTSNAKRFADLKKKGVKASNPKHYAQMQVYMLGFNLERAFYVCVNKDTDDIYTERVRHDSKESSRLLAVAERVIFSDEPLSRISEDPSWFECKWCSQRPVCHLGDYNKLERNCRTCASSTPEPDGKWACSFHKKNLDEDEQRKGCDSHVFIPALLPLWKAVDYQESPRNVTYELPDKRRVDDSLNGLSEPYAPCN